MKVAYFSPLNPQKSGISDYSEALIPYLSEQFDVDLWVDGVKPSNPQLKQYRMFDYVSDKSIRSNLINYDAIIYNIGNNPYYHSHIYDAFLEYPGIVLMHDYVLYYLIAGYYLDFKKSRPDFIREMYRNYGPNGIQGVKSIFRSPQPPLQFKSPERYPLIKGILENAKGIIVHSETTRQTILSHGFPPSRVVKVNQVNYENMDLGLSQDERSRLRKKYKVQDNEILIASFGYIAPTKRNLQVIEAINDLRVDYNVPVKYLMIGEGNYVDSLLGEDVKKTGYIPMEEFEKILACSDIVVNLRYPSMGETSATLLRAMMAKKPCIVSDSAWFSELPGNVVIKISTNAAKEKQELVDALLSLVNDSVIRENLGNLAHAYVIKCHDPRKIAVDIKAFIERIISSSDDSYLEKYVEINAKRLYGLSINESQDYYLRHISDKISKILR